MGKSLWQDVQFGCRMLLHEPGFTAVIVVTLALAIGVNTTVFTLAYAVLFRGLPFDQPDRVMYLSEKELAKNRNDLTASYPDLMDWRSEAKSFQGLAGFSSQNMIVTDDAAAPERYTGPQVTSNLFSLIGQKPFLGRDFRPEEDRPGAAPVCIIGHRVWESRYGRAPDILGKSIRINGTPTTIVGVMPKGMKFPLNADLWIPLVPGPDEEKRGRHEVEVFGRLPPGVSLAQARTEMAAIAARLARNYPKTNKGISAEVVPYNDRFNGGSIRILFLTMLGAVGFVLLIACANVANLLLARSLARAREISIRAALGASRWRVIRQLLIESVLVGLLGGMCGLGVAYWGVHLFDVAVANVGKPYWIVFKLDLAVFSYLASICVVTGVLFGVAPALQLSRLDLNSTLREGGRGSSGGVRSRMLSAILVVSEVGLSIVLLVGAGLMLRSFLKMYAVTNGIRAERYLVVRMNLPEKRYPTAASRLAFYDRLQPRLDALPGVEAAAVTTNAPLTGAWNWQFEWEGAPPVEEDKRPRTDCIMASANYFATAGIAIVRGRAFTETDGLAGKKAVIVSQRFAQKYWPGEDPLGKRLRVLWESDRPWLTVVGVSRDIRQRSNPRETNEVDPLIFVPYRGQPTYGFSILLRADKPTSFAAVVRREVQAIDPGLPVYDVMSLEENFEQNRWPYRVFGTVFAVFAIIAVVLSSVGLYGMMAYAVTRQTQEIGVRLAMGATQGRILRLVLGQGVRQLAIGLAAGLAAAFGLSRVLKSLLFQVSAADPVTFVAVAALLIAVGFLACWLPARAAMKVEPTVALRYE